MAFAFTFESNFESPSSTGDGWDSETDTASQLDIASYKELSRFPWPTAAPFRGAYAMRVQLTGGTADAFVLEGDTNIAAAGTAFYRFMLWISPDFTGTADDTVNIFELQGAAAAIQAVFGLRIVAATNVINFGIGELTPTSFGTEEIERGKWYTIELDVTIDDGGSNDGTIDLYVTKEGEKAAAAVHATQVASLDQIAVIQSVLGMQLHLATTTGTLLYDAFIADTARVYPITKRFPEEILLTKSGHAFVGPGEIENVSLLSGAGTDCVLSIFDTNEADVDDATNVGVELKNTANNEIVDPAGVPVEDFTRGAYVQLSGTTPRALVKVRNVDAFGGVAQIRRLGRPQR